MVNNPNLYEKVRNFLGQDIAHWSYERTMEELVMVGEEILAENVTMADKHAEKDIVLSDYLKTLEQQREQITRLQVEVEVLTQNNSLYRQKVNELRAKTGYKVYEENLALAHEIAFYKEMLKEGQQV